MPLPSVVLVGRTNVGKSSLFNRLTERKQALVSPIAGTTRDFNKGMVEWEAKSFQLIDTGGIDLSHPDDIEARVIEQAWKFMKDANKVYLVTDAKDGVVPGDLKIAKALRENGIPFGIIVNKSDSPSLRNAATEFHKLSKYVHFLSAANGTGTADFLDELSKELKLKKSLTKKAVRKAKKATPDDSISVTFAGLPNMGKSSLVNALLGREEVIVSEQAHTTRESRDTQLQFEGRDFTLVDTAGIRKARKMRGLLQKKSADFSHKAIEASEWVVLVIDATQDTWGEQERYILSTIIKSGASVIIAANKWDLLEGEDRHQEFEERWLRSMGGYHWIPIIPVSALTGWHVQRLLKTVLQLHENRYRELPQSALDRLLKQAVARRRPQKKKGPEAPYVHALKQVDTAPPTFELVIQNQDTLAESWVRFMEKMLREKFEFTGTPVRVYVRATQTT